MIRFLLNDRLVETSHESPTMVALDFVRDHRHLRGTKTGCREGDCGACTVLVGELAADGQRVDYRSMTSCLLPLGNLHGKHLVTIEGLNLSPKTADLNRAQQAIVACSGTQCGFCTVGFAVSLAGHCLDGTGAPTYEQTLASIDGNICRCTGYKSLERAAAQLTTELAERPQADALAWLGEQGFVPAYFTGVAARLAALHEPRVSANGQGNDSSFLIPHSSFLSGGTDLLVQKPEAMLTTPAALLFDRPALKGISRAGDVVRLGAATTAQEMMDSALLNGLFPRLRQYLKLVSSTPIRQMGTVAGNLCNASPIGDLTAMFLALGATLHLDGDTTGPRQVPLREFYLGYKQLAKAPHEWVAALTFAVPEGEAQFHFEKVSKRTHLDIASVNSASLLTVTDGLIRAAHLSAGGVFATPKYLAATSAFLVGRPLTAATLHAANDVMQQEVAPISDARGTEAYKRLLLRQLLWGHFLTLYPQQLEPTGLI